MYEVTITANRNVDSDTATEFRRYESKTAAVKAAHVFAFAGYEVHLFDYEANEFIFDAYA